MHSFWGVLFIRGRLNELWTLAKASIRFAEDKFPIVFLAVDLDILQDCGDPDEAVLQGEPRGENRLPEGRRRRHQEAPLVPGQEIIFTLFFGAGIRFLA